MRLAHGPVEAEIDRDEVVTNVNAGPGILPTFGLRTTGVLWPTDLLGLGTRLHLGIEPDQVEEIVRTSADRSKPMPRPHTRIRRRSMPSRNCRRFPPSQLPSRTARRSGPRLSCS